jgi:pilus assembly protein CpaF
MAVQETRLPFVDKPQATRLQALPATCQFSKRSQELSLAAIATPVPKPEDDLQDRLHRKLVEILDPEKLERLPEDQRSATLRALINQLIEKENAQLSAVRRHELIEDLHDEMLGLGPLEKLLRDASISDILVNGPDQVYVERHGTLAECPVHFRDEEHLMEIIRRIVHKVGRHVSKASPMVDARLPDGSRINAIVPPLALRGPVLSIRRFGVRPLRLDDLLQLGTLAREIAWLLEAAAKARLNILVSGGTGSGKTTLLNVLSSFIPDGERVITIEDAAELQLQQRHVVSLETRPPNIEGAGAVSMRDLVRNALRMRPDRIIVGECRGGEVMDMLQAMNTGHSGSMSTLHANGPRDALARLEMMLLMGDVELPLQALRQAIASAIDLIIHIDRLPGGPRRIMNVTEVVGMERDIICSQDLFVFQRTGLDAAGRACGHFEATGVRPTFMPRIANAGIELPPNLFQARTL